MCDQDSQHILSATRDLRMRWPPQHGEVELSPLQTAATLQTDKTRDSIMVSGLMSRGCMTGHQKQSGYTITVPGHSSSAHSQPAWWAPCRNHHVGRQAPRLGVGESPLPGYAPSLAASSSGGCRTEVPMSLLRSSGPLPAPFHSASSRQPQDLPVAKPFRAQNLRRPREGL